MRHPFMTPTTRMKLEMFDGMDARSFGVTIEQVLDFKHNVRRPEVINWLATELEFHAEDRMLRGVECSVSVRILHDFMESVDWSLIALGMLRDEVAEFDASNRQILPVPA